MLSLSDFKALRSNVGQHIRPDLSFEVCQLSVSLKQATVSELIKVNKCLKMLKSNDVSLTFPKLGDLAKYSLVIYSDASFANLAGYASQGASIVFLSNVKGIYCHCFVMALT